MKKLVFWLKCVATVFLFATLTLICSSGQSASMPALDRRDEQDLMLKEYKQKWAAEMSKLPRPTKAPKGGYIGTESLALANEGADASQHFNLALAEEKLASSLSLFENQHRRALYALVLLEEKKYNEALPSCVDISLEAHEKNMAGHPDDRVEYSSISHLMLAYVLAQVGEVHTAAVAYNFARKWVDEEMKFQISRIPEDRRQQTVSTYLMYRLPMPPVEFDPEKADRKSLIEATRLLSFVVYGSHDVDSLSAVRRFTYSLIDAAYDDNTGSALTNFFKGIITSAPLTDGLKRRVTSARDCRVFYQKTIDIAGVKSEIGKLAQEAINKSKTAETESQKSYEEALKNGYDGD